MPPLVEKVERDTVDKMIFYVYMYYTIGKGKVCKVID